MSKNKSTNKSADFEMEDIFIEDFEDMEVLFEESDEPNSKLGKDLEMVMQETRVFTDEELEELKKTKNKDKMGETRILSADTILLDKLIIEDKTVEDEGQLSTGASLNKEVKTLSYDASKSEMIIDKDSDFEDDEYEEEADAQDDCEDDDSEADDEEYEDDDSEADDEDYEEDDSEADDEDYEEDDSEADDEEYEEEDDEYDDEEDEIEVRKSASINKGVAASASAREQFKPQTDKVVARKAEANKVKADKSKAEKAKTEKSKEVSRSRKAEEKPSMRMNDRTSKASKKSKSSRKKSKSKQNGFVDFLKSMGPTEYILIAVGVVILALFAVVLVKVSSKNTEKNQVEEFASIGALLENLNGIGDEGIQAVAERAHIDSIYAPVDYGYETEENAPVQTAAANVGFASIEKDLKIKFSDKTTGLLITGIKFEVTAMGPDGKVYTWTDDDMDGLINLTNLLPGEYQVIITSIGDYQFPTTPTTVKVQDSIIYQAVNVIDEVKQMKDVNLAEEEFLGDVPEETRLKDTVTWVASSVKTNKVPVLVDKSKINEPKVAKKSSGYVKVDAISVEVGKSLPISSTITKPDESKKYRYHWTLSNNNISLGSEYTDAANVTVNGLAAGAADVTCTLQESSDDGATWTDTTYTETISVTVTAVPDGNIPVSDITLSGQMDVQIGGTVTIQATVSPSNATKQTLEWTSSDPSIASVNAGVVTGIKEGKVTITAKATDGSNISKSIEITVLGELKLSVADANGNDVAGKELQVPLGSDYQLKINVSGASDTSVSCVSSIESSATVSNSGLIHPVAKGTHTVITITTNAVDKNGNKLSVTVNVQVVAPDPKNDTISLLKDTSGNQVYVLIADNAYREAKYADYYTATQFFIYEDRPTYTGWQTINGKVYFYKADGNYVTGEQVIQGTKYNFASTGELSMNGGQLGIDVSSYQGNVDWKAVKNAGISFVILRCGFRGYTQGGLIADDKFETNIQGANAAGLKVGIYIFSQAINEKEAIEEASYCIQLAKKYKVSYPIFIDTEKVAASNARANGLDKNTRTAVCVAFCKTIQNAGYTPGVYANKNWLNNNVNVSEFGPYKIWMAQYVSVPDYKGRYEIWQHTDKGTVSGIKGKVDLDISYLGY